MFEISHQFIRLPVHRTDQHSVVFNVEGESMELHDLPEDQRDPDAGSDDDEAANNSRTPSAQTVLTAYYSTVADEPEGKYNPPASSLRYVDFPQYYRYVKKDGWIRRKKRTYDKICVRVQGVSMVDPEIWYLRLLLLNVPGVTSEESLKNIDYNGSPCLTFQSACMARGLCHDDQEWKQSMLEASKIEGRMGRGLRQLYTTIFVHCHPTDPVQLFHDFADDMSDDFTLLRTAQSGSATSSIDRYRALLWIYERLTVDLNQDAAKVLCLTQLIAGWSTDDKDTMNRLDHQQINVRTPQLYRVVTIFCNKKNGNMVLYCCV